MFEKGQKFETSYNQEVYKFVGIWSDTMVLAPESEENLQVLIYTENEINELLEEGKLKLISGHEMRMC